MSDPVYYIILKGSCIPEDKALIPAVTSGLFYGAGCFETFIAENGSIFKYRDHIERLNRGLDYLGISGKERVEGKKILSQIKKLLEKNALSGKRSRIRIQASLADRGGYSIKNDSSIIVLITTEFSQKKSNPRKLILSETSVVPSSARPSELKLSNMLHYRRAYREAQEKGAHDAVMVNVNGFVAESSIANIFWMKDKKIFTPSADCDILPGIMRNSIIEILRDRMQYEVKEGRFSMDELLKADFVWLANSVLEWVPVSDIEKISFEIDEDFFADLEYKLQTYKKENSIHV